MIINIEDVKKIIPSVLSVKPYEHGIEVFYTGRAPMWKPEIIIIGKFKFKWHYDNLPNNPSIKQRCYRLI